VRRSYVWLFSKSPSRYIGENNRSLFERIFWLASFCLGGFLASYFISALWDKWENSPIYVSVETTSFPVFSVPFPAVSICSVNKILETRMEKTLTEIKKETNELDDISKEELEFMLDAMIRYEEINATHELFDKTGEISAQILLKIFKSVQKCFSLA